MRLLLGMLTLAFLLVTSVPASDRKPVAPPPLLEFRLCEADGRPVSFDSNPPWIRARNGERSFLCVRCPKGETPDPIHNTPNAWNPEASASAPKRFVVELGERYVYALFGPDIDPLEGEVTIGQGDAHTLRELRVEPPAPRSRMQLHLQRPDWRSIGHDVQVNLESLVTGLTLFRSELTPHDLQFESTYPVGRYRLRVETERTALFWDCGEGLRRRQSAVFGEWVETIELVADEPLRIDSFFWSGGKLRLALDLPEGLQLPRSEWEKQYPSAWSPPDFHWLGLASHGPCAVVTLRPDPDAPRLRPERGMPEVSAAPLRFEFKGNPKMQRPALMPGSEELSAEWIPPGAYTVRVEARDFAPVETKVLIRTDEKTGLRVRLAPR